MLGVCRTIRQTAGILLALACCVNARASAVDHEAPPTSASPVSLHSAVAYALSHQPAVRAARQRLIAARSEIAIPMAQWQPSVGAFAEVVLGSANNSTASVLSSREVDLPRIGGTTVRDTPTLRGYPTTAVAVGVRQEVFDFGRIAAQTAAARAIAATDKERLRGTRLDTVLSVTEAYYAVLAARAVLEVATQAEARARLHREEANAGERAGLRPPIERTRAEADLARFQVSRIRAEGGLRVAKCVFAAAVGVVDSELDAAPDESAPFRLPPRLSVQARARDADPMVREAVSLSRAQSTLKGALSASERPNLFVSAAVSGRAGDATASNGVVPQGGGMLPVVPNYSAALVLDWPLYEGVTSARVRAAERRESALLAEVEVARQRAVTLSEQAYRNAESALDALDALQRAADAARANHEQAEARFKSGLSTSVELADAEMLRIDAEIQLAIGKFQIAVQRAILARTMTEEP